MLLVEQQASKAHATLMVIQKLFRKKIRLEAGYKHA
jgi:hypothetical protein